MVTIFYPPKIMTEVVYKEPTGLWPRTTPVDQIASFGGFSIGYFLRHTEKCGTGFIVKLTPSHPTAYALVLTAAHIFLENFRFNNSQLDFLLNEELFIAEPLKNDLDWSNEELFLKDPISNVRISVPEDWVLCTLVKIPGKVYSQTIVPVQFISPLCILYEELEVTLYGFPKVPDSNFLTYVAPESIIGDYYEISNSLCNGTTLVSSKGKIKKVGDILSVSCISANGMSGGPLVIHLENIPFAIGFLCGGPASPLHHYTSRLLNNMQPSLAIAFASYLIDNFDLKSEFYLKMVHKLLKKCIDSTLSPSNAIDLKKLLVGVYVDALKREHSRGKNISYNNCFSVMAIYEPLNIILNSFY